MKRVIPGLLCPDRGNATMADKNFLTEIIDADLAEGQIREIHTRFPPEIGRAHV